MKTVLLFISVFFTFNVKANNLCYHLFEIKKNKHAILEMLSQEKAHLMADVVPEGSKAMLDLRALFITLPASEFNAIWKAFNKEDLFRLNENVLNGKIPATRKEKRRLNALVKFVEGDKSNALWSNSTGAIQRLAEEYSFFRGPGYKSKIDGSIDGVDLSTLYSLRKEILKGATGDRNSRFQPSKFRKNPVKWLSQFFIHRYFLVKNILKFHDQIRDRLTATESVYEAFQKELMEEKELGVELTSSESRQMDEAIATIKENRRHVIDDLSKAYGQDVTTGGFQHVALGNKLIDVYDINHNIKKHKLLQSERHGDFRVDAENAIITLHKILQKARFRKDLPSRINSDRHKFELQVENFRFIKESEEELGEWRSVMNQNSNVQVYVNYHYSVPIVKTKTVTVNGKTKTQTYIVMETRYGSKYDTVTYYELLVERLSSFSPNSTKSYGTIDSVTGKTEALAKSESAYEFEKKFISWRLLLAEAYELISDHQNLLIKASSQPEKIKNLSQKIQLSINGIETARIELQNSLMNHSEANVYNRWSEDNPAHFQSRSKELLDTLIKVESWYKVYLTQLERGEFDLHLKAPKPDDTKLLSRLKNNMLLSYSAKIGVPTALILTPLALQQFDIYVWDILKPYLNRIRP